ncbi:electron transfer flavoprotein subunit beta/FixA family protein [Sporomusa acidovorans]|uniref:Protein FixA n=1 Tax=Sporomusa acidovorans (strain ATCC 49682 / DSM 3132 / Mol) TaxID=1123286 RepID=A0ABZ3J9V4_SPOA4|nr:electron transfer flavoprotein subunit beta/FixA family protein [Sporomusa acidovorans]OZC21706.1 electron transfer flavoprotein subunit beta [Sporomusa acidovorans DSM 3132]SDD59547.1 electron transfer flavoprotein beta subunit [Sporomusa acidovorans]
MEKLLVCYKWVLDEQDIKIAGDLSLDTGRAKYKISDYDKNAIEAGALLAEQQGACVEAVTFGTAAVKQSLKDALSRGLDKVYWIGDAAAEQADAFVTANVLAAAIKKIGQYDLILCGEGSSDSYSQQTAPRLAALLGIPAVTFVQKLTIDGGQVVATRKLGDCTEEVTVTGPAVISVLPEINKPRIPGLKQVMAAAKKPSAEVKVTDLGMAAEELFPKVRCLAIKGYVMDRKKVIFKDDDQAYNVAKLVASLAKEGLC